MASLGNKSWDQQYRYYFYLGLIVTVVASGDVPRIKNREENVRSSVGQTVLLPCLAEGDPFPIIEWYKDQVPVQQTSTRFRTTHRGLRIKLVEPEDSGRYVCRAINGYGVAQLSLILHVTDDTFAPFPFHKNHSPAREVDVEVEEDEEEDQDEDDVQSHDDDGVESNFYPEDNSRHVFGTKPVLRKVTDMSHGLIQRPVGSTVRLKCVAEGDPAPRVRWLKNDKEIPASPSRRSRSRWILTLRNLQPEDSGLYMCQAANRVGAANATFPLEVVDRLTEDHMPELTAVHPLNTTVHVGGIASFQCRVRSTDPPNIMWLKRDENGTLTFNEDNYRVLKSSGAVLETRDDSVYLNKLVISPATIQDSGTYVCLGTNAKGYNFRSAFLIVKANPQFTKPVTEPSASRFTLSLTVVLPVAVVLLFVSLGIAFLRKRKKRSKTAFPKPQEPQLPPLPPQQLPRKQQQQQQQTHLQYPYIEPTYATTWSSNQGNGDRVWMGGPQFASITPPPIPTSHRPTSQGSDRSSHQSRKSSGRHPRQYSQHILLSTC